MTIYLSFYYDIHSNISSVTEIGPIINCRFRHMCDNMLHHNASHRILDIWTMRAFESYHHVSKIHQEINILSHLKSKLAWTYRYGIWMEAWYAMIYSYGACCSSSLLVWQISFGPLAYQENQRPTEKPIKAHSQLCFRHSDRILRQIYVPRRLRT